MSPSGLGRFFASPALLVGYPAIAGQGMRPPRALERQKICTNPAWLSFSTGS